MRRAWLVALAGASLGACTAAQSARVLPVGRTQVTVAAGRSTVDEADDPFWHGAVMVRQGISPRLDGGVFLQRTPGAGGVSQLGVEPKAQLTTGREATVSLALAVGVYWSDGPGGDGLEGDFGGIIAAPTVFLGFDVSPTVEVVIAPRLHLFLPQGEDSDHGFGGALGLRFTDPARTWAVHPELAFMNIDDTSTLTLGLSVAAGN